MAKLTIVIGVLLTLVGAVGFFGTGSQHPTALIPAAFGVLLIICGVVVLARPGLRMHIMHAAMTLALIGCIGTIIGVYHLAQMLAGKTIALPSAAVAKSAMFVLCAVYLALGIRSFIMARKMRGSVE